LAFVWRSRRSPLIDLVVELGLGFRPTHGKYMSLSPWLRLIKTKFNLHLSFAGLFGLVVITRLAFIAGPNPNYKTRKGTAVAKFKWWANVL